MPKTPQPKRSYAEMNAELEDVLAWFSSEEIDIDQAVQQYEKARKLIAELEAHLQSAENSIEKIKIRFSET